LSQKLLLNKMEEFQNISPGGAACVNKKNNKKYDRWTTRIRSHVFTRLMDGSRVKYTWILLAVGDTKNSDGD
jgi:hypothetical protein